MLYQNIERRCKEKGMTISALEKAVDLGNATIKGWVGSLPRIDNLKKVADYFGCTIDELIKEE